MEGRLSVNADSLILDDHFIQIVIPAKAGTHLSTVPLGASYGRWIPASVGMTG